jgi:hypothetical protein
LGTTEETEMRSLPDNASLDHIRRQAKDQLAVLRHADPDASLTDAQASLAQQYGFGNWADLKREVERRSARDALVADEQLAGRLADSFGLGAVSAPMTHVERQWTGDAWDLHTLEGRWVVTALAAYLEPAQIEIESQFVTKAIAAGVLAPEPVRKTDGSYVLQADGGNWRVHRWMRLGAPFPQPPPPTFVAEGGRILGQIHRLGLTPPQPVVPWLTCRPSEAIWQSVVDAAHTAEKVWAEDLARAVPGFVDLDVVSDSRDPNPRAILSKAWHAPAAARPVGKDRVAAINWEHTSATPKDWELGSSLMAWSETVNNDYDPVVAKVFLNGYRELTDDIELTLALFTSGVTAALNWTISRANIALNGDVADHRDEAERNIRVLARNPISLGRVERLAHALT